ncbi:ABC transporter substrate-binding protein [Fulvivirga ligni]|uniref:ABC transporter substrate-binding protein n=1 Tax=Fulvivirga ligni TaxID=2904246 RepID=UPI001F237864|nr:ABC transporter substrate-binding protein [Fulvivirga ligni]UII20673.1 ABC transporter substrate-binding protein [Fulvivirga ligni]
MNSKNLLFLVGFLLCFNSIFAQGSKQQQYLNAKALFNDKSYSLAMEAFKPLMAEEANNPFVQYASFYYAISAYNQGYAPMAKTAFLQIREKYPKWSKVNEVNYWLGKIYLESKEYNQGITALNAINDKAYKKDVYNLKYHYLDQVEVIDNLEQLYQNHPKDAVLAEVLAKKIAAQPLVSQDKELLSELIDKFDLNKDDFNIVRIEKSEHKDRYRVAVLFPFLMNRLEANERPKVNQLVLDLYEGMRLAMDTLKQQGINVELYAYDTKRSKETTQKILEKEELKSMDLIIGPLFSGPRELVQDFSFKNKINMINPLSSDADVIGQNPYSFLFSPSDETVGKKTADYVAKHAFNKTGLIFYGEAAGDSIVANAYKKEIEAEGFNIISSQMIEKDKSRSILDMLVNKGKIGGPDDEALRLKIKKGSLGHIFVASKDELIYTKVISAVQTRGDSVLVVGSADWLELSVVGYDVYQKLGAALYAPLYMPTDNPAYETFRKNYISRHKIAPTNYSAIGYDMMLFMGKSLEEYGKYFQLGWEKEKFMPGYLTPGYSYQSSQDNALVPILNFGPEGVEVLYEIEDKNED